MRQSTVQLQVYEAEPYRSGALGSLGNANYMLLRQFQFPYTYAEEDVLWTRDSDRCFASDAAHTERCYREHTRSREADLPYWLEKAKDVEVMAFVAHMLRADLGIMWTGYRIMGSVAGNGHAIWSFALFAKHPESDTPVYTGQVAPNVLAGPRR